MSVRPDSLATSEGTLISISISVQPSRLESLLEVLAGVSFPVNPQIYHDAALVSRFPDGTEQSESTTLVEFRLEEEPESPLAGIQRHMQSLILSTFRWSDAVATGEAP